MRRVALALVSFSLLALLPALTPTALAQAGKESLLYSFQEEVTDVTSPYAGITVDSKGNFYGTGTNYGGPTFHGGVWELSPPATSGGAWTEQVLFAFDNTGTDAYNAGSGAILDSKGNLYGVTNEGGANGKGAVYELSPPAKAGDPWTEKIIHDFADDGTDGYNPEGNDLVFDSKGNLLGCATSGGSHVYGVIYELTPQVNGTWTETILHNFGAAGDGAGPRGGLIPDASGNFYGTTSSGTPTNTSSLSGTVFELSPASGGTWTYSQLYGFQSSGAVNAGGLLGSPAFDSAGNIYGTSYSGGANFLGTVWEISPPATSGGAWTGQILYSFGTNPDANYPYGSVTIVGNTVYATTTRGGANSGGTIVAFTPKSGGGWNYNIAYAFGAYEGDASGPYSGMIADSNGNLFGTTISGGSAGGGTVFEIAGKTSSATALSITPITVTVGENVVLKATVTGAGATPSGSVIFSADGVTLATITLNGSGVASLTANTNGYPPATYPVTATYTGNATFGDSTSTPVSVELEKAPTATALTASPTSVTPPASVTLTATVKRSTAGAEGTPTGSVTFSAEGTTLAVIKLNSKGVAAITAPSTGYPAGGYPIKAIYSGDSSDTSSTSSTVTVTVK
jgi:uncharacterized repeat protein (TIGR03803 family)